MRNERFTWLVGALVGALDAALVLTVMVASGALTGSAFAVIAGLLGQAFDEGPGWLAPAVSAGSILAAGLIGGRAARRGRESLFRAAVVGVLWLVGAYVAWVLAWTAWRLGVSGDIGSVPFLPVYAALLAFAGLLLPAIVLFLPAALLWAWVVGAVLSGGSTGSRARN
jgi:hypothetical protein